jgi:hypothetical protein
VEARLGPPFSGTHLGTRERGRGRCQVKFGGQASKGIRWMPRRQEAKKDVVSCEKPRGAANKRRSVDIRMGKPLPSHVGRARS